MILVEGPISRDALSALATQILTACIRMSEKIDIPNAFNFHIAIWQGNVGTSDDAELTETLKTRLNQMSYGTKRPVQFVDAVTSDPGPEQEEEFVQRRDELVAKINAIEASPSLQAPLIDWSQKNPRK